MFNYNSEISLEEIKTTLNVQPGVNERLSNDGFILPDRPIYTDGGGQRVYFDGQIPHDLTVLSDKQLGDYLGLLSNWMAYCGGQKALADTARNVAKAQLEAMESKLRLKHKTDSEGKRLSNPERDDIVGSDRHIIEAKASFMCLEAYYVFVNQTYKNAEQNYAAVSRRITQRQSENDRFNRGNSVAAPNNNNQSMFPGGRRR